ncbi:MAG: M13 family metallopeptidase [Kofleriaceae bacterium]
MSRLAVISLLGVACSAAPPARDPAAHKDDDAAAASAVAERQEHHPAGSAMVVTLADVGLEGGSLDRTVDPCTDFYRYACGGWLRENTIPGDRVRWGRLTEIDAHNRGAIRVLLEEAAKGIAADPGTRKLGDFYASCMDTAAIERAGLTAIKPIIAKIAAVKDARTWLAAVVELHRIGVSVTWRATVRADLTAPDRNVVYLDAGALGLPNRDYYVATSFAPKLDGYRAHVVRMLGLLGVSPARAELAAGDVIAIERELAKLTATTTDTRDSYRTSDVRTLANQVTSIEWAAYWKGLGVAPGTKLVIAVPAWFEQLDRIRAAFRPRQWASYFAYHLAASRSFELPAAFDSEAFELDKLLTGVERPPERHTRCVEVTQAALGELIGQHYITKHFSEGSRQAAGALVDAIVDVAAAELDQLDWMTPQTKQRARAKLARVVKMIGFPDSWRTYPFEVKREDFAGNRLRADAFELRRVLALAGTVVDRSAWQLNAFAVTASYSASSNAIVVPAGILQPPLFGQDRSIAANLGGIGAVIGHELIHALDDQGARFDGDGRLSSWWTDADRMAYEQRGSCVARAYSGFEVLPGHRIDGALTRAENIADLAGVKLAFKAYRRLRASATSHYVADGLDEDQQFFVAVAQAWCTHERADEIARRLAADPHAPPRFRVFGALRNTPELATAFRCSAGTAMRPSTTCSVW